MKFFIDCEFIEDGKTIDLISIGLVCKDGREFYAVSNEYDPVKTNDWVRKNVIPQLPLTEDHIDFDCIMSKQQIAKYILEFVDPLKYGNPEFWGEWCSYDWVAFCQLFGDMMNLPKGFPMRCGDVIQWAEDHLGIPSSELPPSLETEGNHNALLGAKTVKERWEFLQRFEENCAMQRIRT